MIIIKNNIILHSILVIFFFVLTKRSGQFIESLGGKYITAEDINIKMRDIEYIAMKGGGDLAPVTAYDTYLGMKATAKKAYGRDDLNEKKLWYRVLVRLGCIW